MKWSDIAWNEAQHIYDAIIEMPFNKALSEGSLPAEQFKFYIAQDAKYLEYFGRTLSLIAARAHNITHVLEFIRFAEGAIVVENELHNNYFNKLEIDKTIYISPTCHHYVHFMQSTAALAQVEIAMAAVLPCFWIYQKVGEHILAHQNKIGNPYQDWINTYGGEAFGLVVEKAICICDEAALNCTTAQQLKMTEAFVTACRLEWAFWDSAWRLENGNCLNEWVGKNRLI